MVDLIMEDPAVALGTFFGVVLIVCLVCWSIIRAKSKENDAQPVLKGMATVIEKPQADGILIAANVLFQLDDGRRITLTMTPRDYGQIVQGDRGQVVWQGTRFISFRRM